MTEYLDRIKNYIFDSRFTRALLIDGDWGCGKSYFVKEKLISGIEGAETGESKDKGKSIEKSKTQQYQTLIISLYGISNIESIQTAIYTAYLDKYTGKIKNDKVAFILKNVALFGTTAIKGVGLFFNVGNETAKMLSQMGEGALSLQKDKIVLIFDDIERCQIDIIELMGFLNNLCENNGYRVILIANEKEIERREDEVARAIQSQTAWMDLCLKGLDNLSKEKNGNYTRVRSLSNQNSIIEDLRNSRKAVKEDAFKNWLEDHR